MNLHTDPTRPLDTAVRMRPLGVLARPRRGDAIGRAGRVGRPVPHSANGASVLGWHLDHDEIPVPWSAMTARLGR